MLSFDEARKIIFDHISRTAAEEIPLTEVLGRVLAENVVADLDIPPYDNSAMDGYAVCAADTSEVGPYHSVTLKIVGETAAGGRLGVKVEPGCCVRIMTGGRIPPGADAIVRVEQTEETTGAREEDIDGTEKIQKLVRIKEEVAPNRDIRKKGEDVCRGDMVLCKGTRLKPAHVGLLASLGMAMIPVAQRPKVGILATGNELLDPAESPNHEKIYSSNNYALMAQIQEAGGEPVLLGIAGDEEDLLRERIEKGLDCDILITTGGVSAGKYDIVRKVILQAGVVVLFHKVAIRPGMPVLFGTKKERQIFGLPGNPVSAMVTFELFVRPSILRMLGDNQPDREQTSAVLNEPIKKKKDRFHFLRGITTFDGKVRKVTTTGSQGSGILSSMGRANCLILLPEGSPPKETGDDIQIMLLN